MFLPPPAPHAQSSSALERAPFLAQPPQSKQLLAPWSQLRADRCLALASSQISVRSKNIINGNVRSIPVLVSTQLQISDIIVGLCTYLLKPETAHFNRHQKESYKNKSVMHYS
jgi:hypothetical protein